MNYDSRPRAGAGTCNRAQISLFLLASILFLAVSACTAQVDGGVSGSPSGSQPPAMAGAGTGSAAAGGGPVDPGVEPTPGQPVPTSCATPAAPVATTRVARLSHQQYDGAVLALFGLDLKLSKDFVADPSFGGFDNNAERLAVVDRGGRDYRRAAEQVALAVVSDAAVLERVAPCATPAATSCGAGFVESLGLRTFRRPLVAAEQASYQALYEQGQDLVETGTRHARGVRVVVEAMLQSPQFLYRVELNDTPASNGLARLSGYEVATRLAFALWNQPPDQRLLELAAQDALSTPEAASAEAERLLKDERARPVLEDFHRQWLGTDTYSNVSRDPVAFPKFVAGIGSALQEEVQRFVSDVTFDRGLGVSALLTDTTSFVNADLAALYGLKGSFGKTASKVQLDPAERAGLLTRIGFLAQNAHANSSAPILRGASVLKRILCNEFPPPPAGAAMTPFPAFSDTVRTGRDQVTELTRSASCAACHHTFINPLGFAFEAFDAAGQHRDLDRGFPLDLTGSVSLSAGELHFDGAVEASQQIAESREARACYAKNWLRYMYARIDAASDACTVDLVAQKFSDSAYGTKAALADLVRTPSFLYRAAESP